MSLSTQLREVIGDENVRTDSQIFRQKLDFEQVPENAYYVTPTSAAQTTDIVRAALQEGAAVVPVGKALRKGLRHTGTRPTLYLSTEKMSHIIRLDEVSRTVHVQAGMKGNDLEEILRLRGLTLGELPPEILHSSIGGLISVRTAGKLSSTLGLFENSVLGVSAVLADGRMIHTRIAPRRSTGPDIARMICGSEGTLAVVTSVVLRIQHRPETIMPLGFRLPSSDHAFRAAIQVLREEAKLADMRIVNQSLAERLLDIPQQGQEGAILLTAACGPTDLAACDRDLLRSAVEIEGGVPLDDDTAQTWWTQRQQSDEHMPTPWQRFILRPSAWQFAGKLLGDWPIDIQVGSINQHSAVFYLWPREPSKKLDDLYKILLSEGAVPYGTSEPALQELLLAFKEKLDPNNILNPDSRLLRESE